MCAIDLVLYQCGCMVSVSHLSPCEAPSRGCFAFRCVDVSSHHCIRADLAVNHGVDLGPCQLGLDDAEARKTRLERWRERATRMRWDSDGEDGEEELGLRKLFAEDSSVRDTDHNESHLDMLVDSMIARVLEDAGT